ncbi:gastrin/cholecystokinin type B receptor-like [Lytechinus variegatus]|uniref:gastrin/cholecystokinin type B receptor-like n=1 Tax=Lytechinus variegatus TaxID=7654 RepID=UPI001BB23610|nr:gastrin/cholecystokinin type B receptor-like [Lytechinus variegatus]
MTKSSNRSEGRRLMLRFILLSLVIVANSSKHTTTTSSRLIGESNSDGSDQTMEVSSTNAPTTHIPISPTDFIEKENHEDKISFQPSHPTGEITTSIVESSTESSVSQLDTTIWVFRFSWSWVTIAQSTISLIGILGNLLVAVVMAVRRSTASSTDLFIAALAISDLLTSILNIPIPRALQVPDNILGMLYCRLFYTGCLTWICVISSTYILVGASFERLAAVVYPLRFKDIFTHRRVNIFIIVAWLFSILSCSYYLITLVVDADLPSRIYCALSDSDSSLLQAINLFNFAIRLVIPVALMIISQTAMAVVLHLQSSQMKQAMSNSSKQSFHVSARNRVIKVMLVVIIIFILCWAPSQVAFVIVSYRGAAFAKAYIAGTVRQTLNLLTFINSSINPFIYAAHYPKFRAAIKDVFSGKTQNVPLFGTDSHHGMSNEMTDGNP